MRTNMRKLTRYECVKCNRLWALTPDFIVIGTRSTIFDGYEKNGRKKWRKEGECGCGVAFDYPRKRIEELKGE